MHEKGMLYYFINKMDQLLKAIYPVFSFQIYLGESEAFSV